MASGAPAAAAKTKDPSGGTTGRVKLYGRLGWMGARAEYSLDGEGFPLPPILVAGAAPHVQIIGGFLILFGGTKAGSGFPKRSCPNKKIGRDSDRTKSHFTLLCSGPIRVARNRLVGRHGGRRLAQRPGWRNWRPVRNVFTGLAGGRAGHGGDRCGADGRDRGKGIRFAGAEQIVAAGGTKIAGRFHQDRAQFLRL